MVLNSPVHYFFILSRRKKRGEPITQGQVMAKIIVITVLSLLALIVFTFLLVRAFKFYGFIFLAVGLIVMGYFLYRLFDTSWKGYQSSDDPDFQKDNRYWTMVDVARENITRELLESASFLKTRVSDKYIQSRNLMV